MIRYSIEPRTRKKAKSFDFVPLQEIYPTNTEKSYWILLEKQEYILQKPLPKSSS